MDAELMVVGFTFVIAAGIVFLVAYLASKSWKPRSNQEQTDSDEEVLENSRTKNSAQKSSEPVRNEAPSGGGKNKVKYEKPGSYSHPWLASNLKGHSGRVLDLDFSSTGKYLVSCAEDRTLMLWNAKNLHEKEHKAVRGNIELDHAKIVGFAPDSKSILVSLSFANRLAVYKLVKKEDTAGVRIQHVDSIKFAEEHKQEIINAGIASNGRFIMSASADNCLIIWDLRGSVLKTIDTKQSNIHCAAVSTCGRFVATSGFTPDVKVFEVAFSRTGEFQDVFRAFELKGHTSGIFSFDFNQDSRRMISVSKDGTWRLYDTDIRYQHGQDPYLLSTGNWDLLKQADPTTTFARIAPNGDTFAIGISRLIRIYRSGQTEPEIEIDNIHTEPITGLKFSLENKFLVSCGDKHIRVFHNLAHYRAVMENLSLDLKKTTGEAMKQRLKEQISEAKTFLKQVLG